MNTNLVISKRPWSYSQANKKTLILTLTSIMRKESQNVLDAEQGYTLICYFEKSVAHKLQLYSHPVMDYALL